MTVSGDFLCRCSQSLLPPGPRRGAPGLCTQGPRGAGPLRGEHLLSPLSPVPRGSGREPGGRPRRVIPSGRMARKRLSCRFHSGWASRAWHWHGGRPCYLSSGIWTLRANVKWTRCFFSLRFKWRMSARKLRWDFISRQAGACSSTPACQLKDASQAMLARDPSKGKKKKKAKKNK